MVWSETLETYREMISAEGWDKKDAIDVPIIQTLTFKVYDLCRLIASLSNSSFRAKLALLIIGKCGFGFSFNWTAPPTAPDGSMSVQESLRIVADTYMWNITAPKWVLRLPFRKCAYPNPTSMNIFSFSHLDSKKCAKRAIN